MGASVYDQGGNKLPLQKQATYLLFYVADQLGTFFQESVMVSYGGHTGVYGYGSDVRNTENRSQPETLTTTSAVRGFPGNPLHVSMISRECPD